MLKTKLTDHIDFILAHRVYSLNEFVFSDKKLDVTDIQFCQLQKLNSYFTANFTTWS